MRRSFLCSLACLSLVVVATLPVDAGDDTPYVGVWSLELRNCGAEESSPDAPMLIAEDRYDQYQTHCEFNSVEAKGGGFKISADCTIGDAKMTQEFTLTVSGDALTFTEETGARDYLRCK